MVVHESFVTRKPLEFTIIVLFIVFLLLLPVYFYTKQYRARPQETAAMVTETYGEVNYLFGSDSDFSDSDKKNLFKRNYENRLVQWTGTLLDCSYIDNGMFKVSIDHTDSGMGDVLFTTFKNCTSILPGSSVTYKTVLIEWKIRSFIGKDGEILTWE